MLRKKETPLQWNWILALTAWSVVFLLPFFWTKGLGVVSKTFMEGSLRFWTGGNPYATPEMGDVFHYSPLFAALYGVFAYAPTPLHLILWAALNSCVFFYAINLWVRFERKNSSWMWLGLVAALMELDISQRYHQANALIIGLVLIAIALYRDKKLFLSGIVFALGINIKIIPVMFALPLLWPFNRRYAVGLFSGLLLFFLLPTIFSGWERNLFLHKEQYMAIVSDLDHRRMLDIANVLIRLGQTEIADPVKNIIAVLSCLIFCGARFVYSKEFPWARWIAFGTAASLLLSPRTESPTFVLLAPCYLLLMLSSSLLEKKMTVVSFFLITIVFTAIWDPFFHLSLQNNYVSKVLGTFIIWGVSGIGLVLPIVKNRPLFFRQKLEEVG